MTQQSANFYDNWLNLWDRSNTEKNKARKAIHAEELEWVRTRQDYRAALMVAPETGFRTWGGVTMLAEIPPGWHTGSHSHGEEAIYIVSGTGFSIIDDKQYDWEEGACIHIPFGSVHQHFNSGDEPVQYFSALAPHLEYYCGINKFEQYEECGETSGTISKARASESSPADRRLVLNRKEMTVRQGSEEGSGGSVTRARWIESMPEETRKGMVGGDKNKGMSARTIRMMGSRPDFYGDEVEITDVLFRAPGEIGGKHAHMEALLYVLDGEGYVVVDDEKVPYKKGTSLHVQGPQTAHQFFNTGTVESPHLRIHFGIRYNLFQGIAKKKFPYLFLEARRKADSPEPGSK